MIRSTAMMIYTSTQVIALLKTIFSKVVLWSGMLWMHKLFSRDTVTVLTYHSVAEPDGLLNVISATPKAFKSQMEYIRKNCNVIGFDDLQDIKQGRKIPKDAVIITFDDGYLDNYTNAYPVLNKLELRATISLITGYIGKPSAWWDSIGYMVKKTSKKEIFFYGKRMVVDDRTAERITRILKRLPEKRKNEMIDAVSKEFDVRLPKRRIFLNWKEIKEMSGVMSYASHTVNHPILTRVNLNQAVSEILDSTEEIERKGYGVRVFTYPNGLKEDMSRKLDDFMKSRFDFVLSTVYGSNKVDKKLFKLRRVGIEKDDSMDMFKIKVSGFGRFFADIYLRWMR